MTVSLIALSGSDSPSLPYLLEARSSCGDPPSISEGVRTWTTFRGHSRLKGTPFIGISLEKLADGDVIASFAGIAAPGSDDDDAVDTLFEVLLDALETYSAEPKLGPVPARQLQILEQHFRRNG